MSKLAEFELVVTKIEYEGKKFNAYKTFMANGKKIDVKFTRDVKVTPDENCVIVVEHDNWNIDRNRKYPCIWVKGIKEVKPIETTRNKEEDYEEMFGKDLPF